MTRLLLWKGVDAWTAEASRVDLEEDGLSASGTQMGVDPVPYRLDYRLETGPQWVTSRLNVDATGEGWRRHLDLRHDGTGAWSCEVEFAGDVDLPAAGGDLDLVKGALDCDLARSPLTNVMPVRRHDLHRDAGGLDFLMAWVSVPDLGVHPSQQRYEHVRADESGSVVRYVGAHRDFEGLLELDRDGLVLVYPQLARRVTAADQSAR
jgi:uncharacterized protein